MSCGGRRPTNNDFLTPEEEKPLIACSQCVAQECIKTGKICDKVEALLPKPFGGINGKKIKFYDPIILEDMATKRAFKLKFGARKNPIYPD